MLRFFVYPHFGYHNHIRYFLIAEPLENARNANTLDWMVESTFVKKTDQFFCFLDYLNEHGIKALLFSPTAVDQLQYHLFLGYLFLGSLKKYPNTMTIYVIPDTVKTNLSLTATSSNMK